MYRAAFFDLDNVLLFFCPLRFFRKVVSVSKLEEKTISRIFQEALEKAHRNEHKTAFFYRTFCQLVGIKVDPVDFMKAFLESYELNACLVPLVNALKANGIHLALLANISREHFAFAYAQFPILQLFDTYVLSYEVGIDKPEKKLFEKALSLTQVPKENCFYTDDELACVQTARSLGIPSELFESPEILQGQLLEKGLL